MSQKPQRVFFQRCRLFLFGMSNVWKSGRAKSYAERDVYTQLAKLASECLRACNEGKQAIMLEKLDTLGGQSLEKYAQSELERMLAGTHEDVPEWLKK